VGTTALEYVVTNAGGTTAINGGTVSTTGVQTYNDAVRLGANTILTSTGAGATGNITFATTLDSDGVATPRSLTVNTAGTTTFGGAVGNLAPLANLTTDAPGATSINGGSVVTTGNQTYNDPVTLGASTAMTSLTGNITFANTVDPTTAGVENLTLASAGDITFTGLAGGLRRLGVVTIISADDVTITAGMNAVSITQIAGSGLTLVNGPINTNGAAGIALTGNNFTINNTVTTTGGGPVTITNAGLLTITAVGDMNLDGPFTQNGAGVVSTAGDITTTNDNISFLRAVTLTGPVALNTGLGIGDITFASTVDGAQNLTLTAGTGNIAMNGTVGGVTPLNNMTINSANNVNLQAVTLTGIINQIAGTGTTTLNGLVTTGGAGVDNITTNAIAFTGTGGINANNGASNVTLTAVTNITSANLVTNIRANNATMTAGTGIGAAANPIRTRVATLNATSNTGGVYISEFDGITIQNAQATTSGDVVIYNATGDMLLNTVRANTGGVFLTAADGSILDNNGVALNITARKDSTLSAANRPDSVVGLLFDPIEVNVQNGWLGVAATGMRNLVSVNINGVVLPTDTLEIMNVPPGLVIFNNRMIGGVEIMEVYRGIATDLMNPDTYEYSLFDEWLLDTMTDELFKEDLSKDDADAWMKKLNRSMKKKR